MTTIKANRRRVLQIFGVAGISGLFAEQSAAAALPRDTDEARVNGDTIESLSSFGTVARITAINDGLLVVEDDSGTLVVTPVNGGRMYSGVSGRVATVDSFIVGDRVYISGEIDNSTIAASDVGSVYERNSLTVYSIDAAGVRANTSIGLLYLDGLLPDRGRVQHSLPTDVALEGLVWTDPRNGRQHLVLTDYVSLS